MKKFNEFMNKYVKINKVITVMYITTTIICLGFTGVHQILNDKEYENLIRN